MWPIITDGCSVVCLSVGLSDTIVNCAKTAELIEMPFWIWMGRRNRVLDGFQIPKGRGNFEGMAEHCYSANNQRVKTAKLW